MRWKLRLACVIGLGWCAVTAWGQEGPRRGGPGGAMPGGPPSPVIQALDTDRDGTVSAAELEKAASSLATLDRNGDGKLSPEELRPDFAGRRDREGREGREGAPARGPVSPAPAGEESMFASSPLPKDDTEKRILGVLDDMSGRRRGMMSVPRDDGRFLRMLVESVAPKNVIEIGTSHGYSAIWMCLALRPIGGKLTTFEIDAGRAAQARENFKKAGVESIVTLVEGDAHKEVVKLKEPIDLLFLDADKEGYIDYLEKLIPLVRPGGLIVAHNMNARQADPRYVKAITTDPKLDTLFVNLGSSGIGLTLKKR